MRESHSRETKLRKIWKYDALRKVAIVLLVFQWSWANHATISTSDAHPVTDCDSSASHEQSIVVSAKKLLDGEDTRDSSAQLLEPIAKSSEYVPDLAEPAKIDVMRPLRVAAVPTLANPVAAINEDIANEDITTEKLKEQTADKSEEKTPAETKSDDKTEAKKGKPAEKLTTAEAEAISFHGIMPGKSKRINVLREWGDPRSDNTQASVLKYRFDDLPSVEVHFDQSLVESIVVTLKEPRSTSELCRRLKIEQLRAVVLIDEEGKEVAEAYPERGVTMRYMPSEQGLAIVSDHDVEEQAKPLVSKIEITSISAEPFRLRAQKSLVTNYTNAIADLETAIRYDRELVTARTQLSELHLKIGKVVTAERYAAEAVELQPEQPTHRLQWAKCLRQQARYDLAVEELRLVLEATDIEPLVRAQALNEMGQVAALGSQTVARRAMPLHAKAIEIADGLAVGEDSSVSLQAQQLLVEAHLAVAVEISRGAWQQKDEVVPQWIERASALAEALIAEDKSFLPIRLQVAVSSLAAAANLDKPINPLLWVEEGEDTVAEIKLGLADPLVVGQYDWQLGVAYFHGAQIEHRRSEPASAIRLGELAEKQLADLAKERDEMPDTAYLMGRLYFQIGAVHAVHHKDHQTACQWYDQAADRLLNPVPVTTSSAPQQHGDALVSMGVSYWSEEQRERAIEVTQAGLELIEQAVSSGLLEKETLNVSYSNLSAMYEAQGDNESAARYQQLAKSATDAKVSRLHKVVRKSKPGTSKRR